MKQKKGKSTMCKEFYVSVCVSFSSFFTFIYILNEFSSCMPVSFLCTVGSVMCASFILLHCWISRACQFHSFALLDQSCMPVPFHCPVGSVMHAIFIPFSPLDQSCMPVSFLCPVGSVMHASFIPLYCWIGQLSELR